MNFSRFVPTDDIFDAVLDQCMPPSCVKTKTDVRAMLEDSQDDVLFILDGYEKLTRDARETFGSVVRGELFPRSAILMTTTSDSTHNGLLRCFRCRRLTLLGTEINGSSRLVKKYIDVTDTPSELYEELLLGLWRGEARSLCRLAAIPLLCLCMCLVCETGSDVTPCSTRATLVRAFFEAIQKLHCSRKGIDEASFPDTLTKGVLNLEKMAMRCVSRDVTAFSLDDISNEFRNHDMFQLGLLSFHLTSKFTSKIRRMCCFSNTMFEEALLARQLTRLEPGERQLQFQTLPRRPFLTALVVSLPEDNAWANLEPMYVQMADENLAAHIGTSGEQNNGISEGNIARFDLSLICLHDTHDCPGEAVEAISKSLPCRLYMKQDRLPANEALSGLAVVLNSDPANITQLDLFLCDHGDEHHAALTSIATALAGNSTVTSVTLRWTDADLLSFFVAEMFGRRSAIAHVKCIDHSPTAVDVVSATSLMDLRKAGEHMASVCSLSFANCRNASFVTGLFRYLPLTLREIHLPGSFVDVVCARALARHLEATTELQLLNLEGATLRSADFMHVTGALRRANSLRCLVLSRTSLDVFCMNSIAEALTLNTSLRQLDVRGTDADITCILTSCGSLCRTCRKSDGEVLSFRRRQEAHYFGGHRVKVFADECCKTMCFTRPLTDYLRL